MKKSTVKIIALVTALIFFAGAIGGTGILFLSRFF
jgi:hypothetical protein